MYQHIIISMSVHCQLPTAGCFDNRDPGVTTANCNSKPQNSELAHSSSSKRKQTRNFSVLFQYLKTKKKNRESKDTATRKPLLPCCLFHLTIITAGQGHKDGKSSAISKLREVILFYDGVQVGGGMQLQMARQYTLYQSKG